MGNSVYSRDEVVHHKFDDISRGSEWFFAMMYILGAVFLCSIIFIHAREMYFNQDLFPKKEKKKINPWYAAVQWYTLFSLIFYGVYQVGLALCLTRTEFCFNECILGMNGFYAGRSGFYAVGILRLKLMYIGTKYEYSTNTIIIIVSLSHAVYFVASNLVWYNLDNIQWIESRDPSYPRFCVGRLDVAGYFFIVAEIIFVFGLILAFWYRLKQILKFPAGGVKLAELKSYALRVTILYVGAAITSIIFLIIILSSGTGWIALLDTIVTTVALCLMTSYYPRAYENLCCCWIALCDPNKQSTEYGGSVGDDQRKYAMISMSQFTTTIRSLDDSSAMIQDEAKQDNNTSAVELQQDVVGDTGDVNIEQQPDKTD